MDNKQENRYDVKMTITYYSNSIMDSCIQKCNELNKNSEPIKLGEFKIDKHYDNGSIIYEYDDSQLFLLDKSFQKNIEDLQIDLDSLIFDSDLEKSIGLKIRISFLPDTSTVLNENYEGIFSNYDIHTIKDLMKNKIKSFKEIIDLELRNYLGISNKIDFKSIDTKEEEYSKTPWENNKENKIIVHYLNVDGHETELITLISQYKEVNKLHDTSHIKHIVVPIRKENKSIEIINL